MQKRQPGHLLWSLLVTMLALSCQTDYEKMLEREMGSKTRQDSIFFGLYFGMNSKDFYQRCFELNRQGLVTNGPENNTVLYRFSDNEYRSPVDMNFYPAFSNDRIYLMGIVFNYQGWAPWNKDLYAEKLVPDVLGILEKWYGSGFLHIKSPDGKPIWVKVTGNRQILVRLQNERNVRVEISDLTVRPPAADAGKNTGQRPVWEKNKSDQ